MIAWLDVVAGSVMLAVGIIGWRRFRTSALFALAAAAMWFAGSAMPFLVLLHRPLLLHSILALPRGLKGPWPRILLLVAWLGVVLPTSVQPWVSGATAALCVAVATGLQNLRKVEPRPELVAARRALLVLAAGLLLPVLERAVWPRYGEAGLPIATYLCAITICAGAMIVGMLTPSRQATDAVIEFSSDSPAEALAELRGLADAEPDARHSRALWSAIALLEDNAGLHRDLAERIEEVRASRARLIGAAIRERQRLERVLAEGPRRYVDELEECLRSADADAEGGNTAALATCLGEMSGIRDDLDQLARGLHPRVLAERGLVAALEELCDRSPVPVEVRAPDRRFPERTETTVWYACAEALANVWKYAQASRATVVVEESQGVLWATIQDDGVGGAQLSSGGGLTGLVDRLSAVDGELALESSPAGTSVTVMVPL